MNACAEGTLPNATPRRQPPQDYVGSAAARNAPSGGCSLPTARRPSRPRSRPAASRRSSPAPTSSSRPARRRPRDPRRGPRPRAAVRLGQPGRRGRAVPLRRRPARRGAVRRPAGRDLRRRPRPRQRRHRHPLRRRGRRRRGGARGSSVDAYNPKTVRASVGSLFHLPLAVEPSAEAAVRAAKEAGLTVLAADGAGEVGLYDAPLAGPTAWLFGNEAWGLPAGAGRARRPPGRHPDPRPGREPQPLDRRRALPLRVPPRSVGLRVVGSVSVQVPPRLRNSAWRSRRPWRIATGGSRCGPRTPGGRCRGPRRLRDGPERAARGDLDLGRPAAARPCSRTSSPGRPARPRRTGRRP